MTPVPIIDVFAGPGGLAEGFSSMTVDGRRPYRVALSVEKDVFAHKTLLLRGFYRQFQGGPPPEYWAHFRGELSREDLFAKYPREFRRASAECVRHELGPATDAETRQMVRAALGDSDGAWGLIGGPPCQAYSLVGRSRNRGVKDYDPELDHRQTLYVEYLQIVADHQPAFFVMENVKGLLSATLADEQLFERILSDLHDPATALRRENRRAPKRGPRYRIHSLVRESSGLFGPARNDVVVKCEEFGIPQARHRVILLGVREDVPRQALSYLRTSPRLTLRDQLRGMPKLRSGATDWVDDPDNWVQHLRTTPRRAWMSELQDDEVREAIHHFATRITSPRNDRGAAFVPSSRADSTAGGFANHSARGHMAGDLDRYFFASCFAHIHKRSPALRDFPQSLVPAHKNATIRRDADFADRFRVQVWQRPSTTIMSHISKDGHYYIHPDPLQCRSLTVREAARLQTFPDDYLFCGARTHQYHQVGNAVPPELARQIAAITAALI